MLTYLINHLIRLIENKAKKTGGEPPVFIFSDILNLNIIEKGNKNMVLVFVTNIYVFMESLEVLENKNISLDKVYLLFNENYVKSEQDKIALKNTINKLNDNFKYIDYENAKKNIWDEVICSSYIPDKVCSILKDFTYKNLECVEDGTYDYFTKNFVHPELISDSYLWLFTPEKGINTHLFKGVKKLNEKKINNNAMTVFDDELKSLNDIDKNLPVIFTSALKEDFNFYSFENEIRKFIKENYHGKTILLKKHPRDYCNYDIPGVNIIEIPKKIPGQIVDYIMQGEKLYLFPSTVGFMAKDKEKTKVLKFNNCKDERYEKMYKKIGNDAGMIVSI